MDPEKWKILQDHLPILIENLDFEILLPFLIQIGIFSDEEMPNILTKSTEELKQSLVLNLPNCSPEAYDIFLEILDITGHDVAFNLLKSNFENCAGDAIGFVTPPRIGNTQAEGAAKYSLRVTLATTPRFGDEIFKMSSNPRGICLIFNIVEFIDPTWYRYGSDRDARDLEVVFKQLGYRVQICRNLTAAEIKNELKKFSKLEEHKKYDSVVLIFLSHGNRNCILGSDANKVYVESNILKRFNNENCPNLIDKPKIIFVQACRGEKLDKGVLTEGNVADSIGGLRSAKSSAKKTVTWSEMMIYYATMDGYKSFRNEFLGAWFIRALIRVLVKCAHDTDLNEIMRKVEGIVKKRIGRVIDEKQKVRECLQATQHDGRGWSKTFYFNPGLFETAEA